MDYKVLAKNILDGIGGVKNVVFFTHCATRLRFNLKDESIADDNKLKRAKGVMGVVRAGGQYQVVIGSDVPNVYNELNKIGGFVKGGGNSDKKDERSGFVRALDTLNEIFTPIIPTITGAGILKALMTLLVVFGRINTGSQTYKILTIFADSAFYFLPFMLTFSAAKKFNCNIVVAMSIAGILLHPDFVAMLKSGDAIRFIKIPVISANYSSSVIPIILSIWFMSYIEPISDRISPSAIKFFIKPLITLVITGAAAILVLGPLGAVLGDGIAAAIKFLDDYVSWLAPTIIGVFSPFMVMTGTHYGLIPIGINNIATIGVDTIVGPGMLCSNIAQGGAAFAIALKTKNKQFRRLAASAGITAVCGITEPAMYGVNLKLKRPLVSVMIAGGTSGLFMGLMVVGRYTTDSSGLLALPGYIGTNGFGNILYAVIGCAVAFVIGFVGTLIGGFEDVGDDSMPEKPLNTTVCAPIKGRVVGLAAVGDPIFAEEILGKGAAIVPETNLLIAPCDGIIENIPNSKHAVAFAADNGAQILMHIGIDTVNLKGEHFKAFVSDGDRVKMGDPMIEFDAQAIRDVGYDLTTPVVITNTAEYDKIERLTKYAEEQKAFLKLTALNDDKNKE